MLGIDTNEQRRMMEESFDVLMALFKGETVTSHTDWFTCEGARLQMRPYSDPLFDVAVAASLSPAGPKTAGKHGAGLLSIAATNPLGFEMLAGHWKVMEEQAAFYGTTVDRRKWRMMGPMHLAETEEQALENCRYGLAWVFDYLSHVIPTQPSAATTYEEVVQQLNETGSGVVGTPEMAIAQIQRLIDESGGFGCYLFLGADLADWKATLRSYELFAEYVMPHFQGQLAPVQASYDSVMGAGDTYVDRDVHRADEVGGRVPSRARGSRHELTAQLAPDAPSRGAWRASCGEARLSAPGSRPNWQRTRPTGACGVPVGSTRLAARASGTRTGS